MIFLYKTTQNKSSNMLILSTNIYINHLQLMFNRYLLYKYT